MALIDSTPNAPRYGQTYTAGPGSAGRPYSYDWYTNRPNIWQQLPGSDNQFTFYPTNSAAHGAATNDIIGQMATLPGYKPGYNASNWVSDPGTYGRGYWQESFGGGGDDGGSGGGGGSGSGGSSGSSGSGGLPNLFQPDKFQRSSSSNRSSSRGYTGLPRDSVQQIADVAVPEMLDSIGNIRPDIENYLNEGMARAKGYQKSSIKDLRKDYNQAKGVFSGQMDTARAEAGEYTKAASKLFQRQARQALEGPMTNILNNLANKNVLKSSQAEWAISDAAQQIVPLYANKGYEAALVETQMRYNLNVHEADELLKAATWYSDQKQGIKDTAFTAQEQQADLAAKLKANIPNILSSIAALAKYSESSASSSGSSMSENPLQPYQLMSDFLLRY